MEEWLAAALLAGVLGAAAAWLGPRAIAALPESTTEPHPDDPPRPSYAAVAAKPGLAPALALTAGLAGALAGASVGLGWPLVHLVVAVPTCTVLAYVDWRTRLLPSRLVLPLTAVLLVLVAAEWLVERDTEVLVRCLLGLVVVRSVFWVLWWLHASGLGFGDVRLAAALALVLARLGWPELLLGLWAAFPLSSLPWLLVALLRRDRSVLKRHQPLGPFLALGALLGVVGADPLLRLLYG